MSVVYFNLIFKLLLQLAFGISMTLSFFNSSLIAGGPSKMTKYNHYLNHLLTNL